MAFANPHFDDFNDFLNEHEEDKIPAKNFLEEERLGDRKNEYYENYIPNDINDSEWEALNREHKKYMEDHIWKPGVAETFMRMNVQNAAPVSLDTELVRVEVLQNIVRDNNKEGSPPDRTSKVYEYFEKYDRGITNDEVKNQISRILTEWDEGRDDRPRFVGFWEDIKDYVEGGKKWANRVRDLFGMSNLGPNRFDGTVLVMFKYAARDIEIKTEDTLPLLMSAPTILDTEVTPNFCPVDSSYTTGRCINLMDEDNYFSVREMVHKPFDYEIDNIYAVDEITEPPGRPVEDARRDHVQSI